MTGQAHRVSVRYLLTLQEVWQDHGVGTSRLAQVSGIGEDLFNDHNAFVNETEVPRFIQSVRELTGREDLGFEMGRRIKVNTNGPLGYGLLSSTRMHDFMGMMARYYHLLNATWTMQYRRNYSGGEVVYLPCAVPDRLTLYFGMEAITMALQNQIHLMLHGEVPTYDIHMAMPRPDHVHRYAELAPARFHFHENALPSIRFVMGSNLLDAPLPLGDPQVMREVEERYGTLGAQPPRADVCWADHVTMLLREAPGRQLTLEDLAHHIHMSARTIDRYLKKEGVGYRELADKVRFEHACSLLRSQGPTVVAVAEQLGFSDAANFSRAFKRVLGVTPSEYQRGES